MKEVVIVHTPGGFRYACFIGKELNLCGVRCYLTTLDQVDWLLEDKVLTQARILIHFRTAGQRPNEKARQLEKIGYRVINKSCVLNRTSDKYLSYKWAEKHGLRLPTTMKFKKVNAFERIKNMLDNNIYVLKPVNSQGGGRFCYKASLDDGSLEGNINQISGNEIILQEFVDYKKLYRVIVIGGKVIKRAVFSDVPEGGRWQVSVCVNPQIQVEKAPAEDLLEYARNVAKIFEAEVAFVDIFETRDGFVLSELNTACSLILHERRSKFNISREISDYLISQFD